MCLILVEHSHVSRISLVGKQNYQQKSVSPRWFWSRPMTRNQRLFFGPLLKIPKLLRSSCSISCMDGPVSHVAEAHKPDGAAYSHVFSHHCAVSCHRGNAARGGYCCCVHGDDRLGDETETNAPPRSPAKGMTAAVLARSAYGGVVGCHVGLVVAGPLARPTDYWTAFDAFAEGTPFHLYRPGRNSESDFPSWVDSPFPQEILMERLYSPVGPVAWTWFSGSAGAFDSSGSRLGLDSAAHRSCWRLAGWRRGCFPWSPVCACCHFGTERRCYSHRV